MILKNNNGYILPSVLFISLLVTTLLFGILAIIFFYNNSNQKMINKTKLDLACYSALQQFISNPISTLEAQELIIIDSIKVKLSSKLKGLYTQIATTAINGKDSSKVIYLLGNKMSNTLENAIIISKENLRASVAGNTKVTGDMLLTSDKIKIGRISGIKSAGKNYLDGKITIQEDIETKFFNEQLFLELFNNEELLISSTGIDGSYNLDNESINTLIHNKNSRINGDLIISGDIKSESYSNTNIIVSGEVILRSESRLIANLKIISDSSITIEENTIIEDAILFSKNKIVIEDNSQLKNVQLFSQKGIEITRSEFKYPSILFVYSNLDEETNLNNKIKIEASIVNGSIMLINSTTGLSNNKNLIEIDEDSKIQGLVYCENNCKIAGDVSGVIYTYSFWYYKEPTEYINWLVDVKVDRNKLNKAFLLPLGLTKVNNYDLLKETWIN
ncbi:MAG: hypothetical protein KDC67_12710 [Ignavibacteriae bacterium]|nr:hypothetical protein [Ignavibacteriota bacterium]